MSINNTEPIVKIIEYMKRNTSYEEWWKNYTHFQNLMGIIISQRTNMTNGLKAFRQLLSRFKTIKDINNAETIEIENAIKCAGMAKAKAQTIKAVADYISTMYNGDLNIMLCKNYKDIRDELMKIKGIGPKTSDVFLMVTTDARVLPIDTHIHRILRRLDLARTNLDYEDARSIIEKIILPDERKLAHLLLIEFGRKICQARRPLCQICPASSQCPYYRVMQRDKNDE